jgi:type VI secretion system secreted protein Hcp
MKTRMLWVAAAVCVVLGSDCFAALNAYLRLTGETQGEIKGSVTQKGREDSIMVIAFSHDLTVPRDPSTGQPAGKRSHSPLTITKEIDKSTPLLMNALVNNERMTRFELRFWQPSVTGQEVQHYTIILMDAQIVSIRQEMLNNKYPENMQHKEREHVSFTYRGIEKIWEDGGITGEDEWAFFGNSIMVTDLNGDGFVNLIDLAMLAQDWMLNGGGPR